MSKNADLTEKRKAPVDHVVVSAVDPVVTEPVARVAPRCALTSKVGILGEGDEVKAEFFEGDGVEVLRGFIASGHVVVA
jgi:putative ubiquitin-RnfH superfamily antitoxin RatB of RatAB toxin-antitoxin module